MTATIPTSPLLHDVLDAVDSALPHPGRGRTRERFEAFVELGRRDLALAKVVEPHHDALAILADLEAPAGPGPWAVWASEPPFAVVEAHPDGEAWRLDGRKAFCSGAALVRSALVTARDDGRSRLFAVSLDDPGIRESEAAPAWVGPGMRDALTVTLDLSDVRAEAVGGPGAYVDRPGFWHGAMGVAACWLGGAEAVAEPLERATSLDDHGLAHRGQVRVALHQARVVLRDAAESIDRSPTTSAEYLAQCVRATVADTVDVVIRHVGRALGPGPLAFDADHVRRVADLQVFVRQHHAERDLARLGDLDPA